jgi:hypothetical protein
MSDLLFGYKVVGKDRKNGFTPATHCGLPTIRYNLREFTKQDPTEHGPFAVFTELNDAIAFRSEGYNLLILLCEYEPSQEESLWYWVDDHRLKLSMGINKCPSGTVFAKAVRPLEIVK